MAFKDELIRLTKEARDFKREAEQAAITKAVALVKTRAEEAAKTGAFHVDILTGDLLPLSVVNQEAFLQELFERVRLILDLKMYEPEIPVNAPTVRVTWGPL